MYKYAWKSYSLPYIGLWFTKICRKPIMFGSGQSKNRKPNLIQTKLLFTSNSGQLSEAGKGVKRKMADSGLNEQKLQVQSKKFADAAVKRPNVGQLGEKSSSINNPSAQSPSPSEERSFGKDIADGGKTNTTQNDSTGSRDTNDHYLSVDMKHNQGKQQSSQSISFDGKKSSTTQKDQMSADNGSQSSTRSDDPGDLDNGQSNSSSDLSGDEGESDSRLGLKKPDTTSWKVLGTPIKELQKTASCLTVKKWLEFSHEHTVCFYIPFSYAKGTPPRPHPYTFTDKWDGDHVRMPCSRENKYPVDIGCGNVKLESRWELIAKALNAPIPGPFELEEAILSYNHRYHNKWNFTALHKYFDKNEEEKDHFFDQVLPNMVKLALQLPDKCTKAIPLLKKGRQRKITLSQEQIACLLANAFFCTFPRRNSRSRGAEYSTYPDINFNNLFQGGYRIERKVEKLACIINYFKRVCNKQPPAGVVTFFRQVRSAPVDWRFQKEIFTKLHVSSKGTIEDDGCGMLQVDFANKYLGGGALNNGLVQEEIRFMICPEMIISRLFTEVLEDNECLIMTGCEQFNTYNGYADTFEFAGNYDDVKTTRDESGRLCCEVVAIDALVFKQNAHLQFKTFNIERELNKAYCGFFSPERIANRSAVCTGNWGCGAFNGNKQLKSLIQLMAAAVAKRDVCYFTFEDDVLTQGLFNVHKLLTEQEKTVCDVYKLILDYNKEVVSRCYNQSYMMTIFDFIFTKLKSLPFDYDESSNEFRSDQDSNYKTSNRKRDSSPDYHAQTP